MRRIVIAAAMSLCMVSFATVTSADTLIMRDGTRVGAGPARGLSPIAQRDAITRRLGVVSHVGYDHSL